MNKLVQKIKELQTVSAGHITHDRYNSDIVLGGCAFFGAATAHYLGADSKLLTATGDDFAAEKLPPCIKIHNKQKGKTTVFTNIYPAGKPRVQYVETQAADLKVYDFPSRWHKPDLLFTAPVMGEISPWDNWSETAAARFNSLSLQGYMKKGVGKSGKRQVVQGSPLNLNNLLDGIDAVFLSKEDIRLFGQKNLLNDLRKNIRFLYLTDGEKGCTLFTPENIIELGIYPVNCIDPTGAGDTFAMATSLALTVGENPASSALLGAAAASIIVENKGSLNLSKLSSPEVWKRFEYLIKKLKINR